VPSNYKVLGQQAPAAATATTLYTVPAATQTVLSTLNVCNTSTSSATYRVAIRPAGATLALIHYIVYDAVVLANDSVPITIGITLAATDVVTVYSSSAALVFSAFGSEVT
jgi:hypothetical protein